ncbi:MAG: hypothetical protein J6B17_00150, partial [Ruminococcus sp.]|nr:hypothetical protein [Ruminococcus sp.]
ELSAKLTEGIVKRESDYNFQLYLLGAIPSVTPAACHLPLLRGGFRGVPVAYINYNLPVDRKENQQTALQEIVQNAENRETP